MPPVLLTGAAGFIGFHTAKALLARGLEVLGLDNLNAYYDPALKKARLEQLQAQKGFTFLQADIADRAALDKAFASKPDRVINLAAQAGFATRCRTPAPTSPPTSWASPTSSKPAARTAFNTWSTPPPARSTAPTPYPSPSTTASTTR